MADFNPQLLHFVRLLTGAAHQDYTLVRLLAESNVSAYDVMVAYKKAAFVMGQTIAITKTTEAIPRLIEQLTRDATDHVDVCMRCKGEGEITKKPKNADEVVAPKIIDCPMCGGTGQVFIEADEKAQQKLINVLQLGPKQTTITAVKVSTGGGMGDGFSSLIKDSDDAARAIEGELVDKQETPHVPPEGGRPPAAEADDAGPA